MEAIFNDWKQYWYVIKELTAREIKRKYARSYLGIIWSVLNPLLSMIVLTAVFSSVFNRSVVDYSVYLLTGQIIWGLFNGATSSAMTALVDNKGMLIKTKLPMGVFVLARVYSSFVNFLFSCIAFLLVVTFCHILPNINWLFLVADMVLILLFSIGIGLGLSIFYVFFGDIKYLYSVFLTLVMYLSAIFYPVDRLSEGIRNVVEMNPAYLFIMFARTIIIDATIPPLWVWIRLLIWTGVSLLFGFSVFKKKSNEIMAMI